MKNNMTIVYDNHVGDNLYSKKHLLGRYIYSFFESSRFP